MARPLPKSSPDDEKSQRLVGCLGVWVASIAHLPETGSQELSHTLSLSLVHSYLSWHGWDLKLSVLCKLASPFQPRRTSDMLSVCVAWTPS